MDSKSLTLRTLWYVPLSLPVLHVVLWLRVLLSKSTDYFPIEEAAPCLGLERPLFLYFPRINLSCDSALSALPCCILLPPAPPLCGAGTALS